jgi:lipopolysaccharide biosynthesis regulator YciM
MTACHEAEALAPQFPDFAYVYCWWASALVGMSEFDEARAILAGAIDRSKQKYPLCELLGKIEWKSRRIDDAIYWWAQAMHCQESLCDQNYGGDIGAYLYLYYVADGLGLINEATALLMRVDQIQFGTVRLAPGPANDLRMLAQKASERPVPEVLHQLVATYIVPEKKIEKEVDPTEFAQLIRQLVGGSYDKRSAAAKRLGDLGDPQAIVPLRNAVQEDPVIGFKEEVEEAIKRIMEANR